MKLVLTGTLGQICIYIYIYYIYIYMALFAYNIGILQKIYSRGCFDRTLEIFFGLKKVF